MKIKIYLRLYDLRFTIEMYDLRFTIIKQRFQLIVSSFIK